MRNLISRTCPISVTPIPNSTKKTMTPKAGRVTNTFDKKNNDFALITMVLHLKQKESGQIYAFIKWIGHKKAPIVIICSFLKRDVIT